jgi:hypothetical protein
MTSTTINKDNLADKSYSFSKCREYLCLSQPVKKIMQEIGFIDKLQSLVEYGNLHVFESFKIRIQMENEDECDTINHQEKVESGT